MTAQPDIFLSYNREDQARAKLFAEAFEAQGFKVWWDVGLRTGETYDEVTETALRTAAAVVVLWSKKSVQSRWVRAEATLADRNKTLVPCMIETCERPIMFELTQTAELSHWEGSPSDKAWVAFLSDVRGFMERAPAKKHPPLTAAGSLGPAPVAPGPERGGRSTIAIMPFVNRSGEKSDDVFADGMVEDLISALSLSRAARVIASSATRSLRHQATDLRLIGRELGAGYILEGNVRRVGDTLRVTAQLVSAESGAILWTQKFDRPLAELAALQEALISEVAAHLGVKLQALEMQRALKKPGDITAWEALMRSFSAYGRLGFDTVPVAIAEARRAVALAPDYAVAHGCLALALGTLYLFLGFTDKAMKAEAEASAERALALNPDDPNVLWTVSWAFAGIEERERAIIYGERAVEAAPHSANARGALAQAYLFSHRPVEAVAQMDEADRLAPRGFSFYISLQNRSAAHWQMGDDLTALAIVERALALSPNYGAALHAKMIFLSKLGRNVEAGAALIRLRKVYPGITLDIIQRLTRGGGGYGARVEEALALATKVWNETPLEQ